MDINISNYLRIDLVDVILVCISTLILCLVAKHFFWDVILDYFKKRHDMIAADIQAGEDAKIAGETYKARYEEQMASAKSEAHEIVETAVKHAGEEKKEIVAKAKQEAEHIKAKAHQDMEREKVQAQSEMKQAVVDVAFEAAKQIVKKEIDEDKQKSYVDDFIEHVGEDKWQD
ncbi:F0F1 ATP synthase subunit B [Amedibacillus sp. YH-ame10]